MGAVDPRRHGCSPARSRATSVTRELAGLTPEEGDGSARQRMLGGVRHRVMVMRLDPAGWSSALPGGDALAAPRTAQRTVTEAELHRHRSTSSMRRPRWSDACYSRRYLQKEIGHVLRVPPTGSIGAPLEEPRAQLVDVARAPQPARGRHWAHACGNARLELSDGGGPRRRTSRSAWGWRRQSWSQRPSNPPRRRSSSGSSQRSRGSPTTRSSGFWPRARRALTVSDIAKRIGSLSPERQALLAARLRAAAPEAPSGRDPIAIVGIGCRFPGGARHARAVLATAARRRDRSPRYRATAGTPTSSTRRIRRRPARWSTRWGGFLPGLDRFEPTFFGISPRETASLDPQQRLVLEVAWEALEDAGQSAGAPGRQPYRRLRRHPHQRLLVDALHAMRGSLDAYSSTGTAR